MISQKLYVKNNGGVCPCCESANIEVFSWVATLDRAYDVKCLECQKVWENVYELSGYKLALPDVQEGYSEGPGIFI